MSDNTFHDNPETPTTTASSPPTPGDTAAVGQSPPTGSTPPALDTSPAQVEKLALELFVSSERIDTTPSERDRSSAADDAVDALYTRRLREVQNLAAATTLLADATVPGEQADGVPAQLDALTVALGQARRDALADGVSEDDVIAAELLGTEGVPWAAHPSHRWLGRIERLGAQVEDFARQAYQFHEQVMRLRIHITGQNNTIRGLEHQLSASHTTLRELLGDNAVRDIAAGRTMGDAEVGDENLQHSAADSGRDIGEAINATSQAPDGGQWVPETGAPPEDPAARPEWGREL